MEFDIKDAVLALVDAGVYDIYQKNVLQEQISYVEDAVYNRSRVIPYSSNIEMIIFVKQCCDYLLETDRFTFKQAFKDWNVSGMMTKQCFYTSVWNTEVLIQTDDSEPVYCTRKKIYEICSRSEYLDMDNHAQPIEIITHAATDRQVSMFILVMKSLSDGTTNYYKPKFHHVYTIPSFHIMLNFFYFTSSIYTIKSRLRQGVRGDGRGSKPVWETLLITGGEPLYNYLFSN